MVTYHSRETAPRRRRVLRSTRASRVEYDLLEATALHTTKVRLIVFRPGLRDVDRTKVATYAWIRYRGLWLLLAAAGLFVPTASFQWRLVSGALVAGGALLVSWLLARPTLAQAHGIWVQARGSENGPTLSGDVALFEELVRDLDALEEADLSPVAHEDRWGQIYTRLAAVTPGQEQ